MKLPTLAALLALSAGALQAQMIDVKDAWVRASVQGQNASGAFMKLTAKSDARLVSVSTPVAGVAEIHEMKMGGGVMTMRPLPDGLELPAGKTVELKPGGYHLMLMDLKANLPKGGSVPMTLVFKDAKGKQSKVELTLPVATVAPGRPGTGADAPGHVHRH